MSLIDTGIKIFFLLFCKCHLCLMSTVQFTKCCDPNVLWRITSPILLVQNSCSWSKNHVCSLVHFSLIQAWPQASLQTPVKQWWICSRVPYHQSLLELWTCSRYILWAAWKLLPWRKAVVWLALFVTESNPHRFGPIPVWSGRFGPISGVSRFDQVGAGRFHPIS